MLLTQSPPTWMAPTSKNKLPVRILQFRVLHCVSCKVPACCQWGQRGPSRQPSTHTANFCVRNLAGFCQSRSPSNQPCLKPAAVRCCAFEQIGLLELHKLMVTAVAQGARLIYPVRRSLKRPGPEVYQASSSIQKPSSVPTSPNQSSTTPSKLPLSRKLLDAGGDGPLRLRPRKIT